MGYALYAIKAFRGYAVVYARTMGKGKKQQEIACFPAYLNDYRVPEFKELKQLCK